MVYVSRWCGGRRRVRVEECGWVDADHRALELGLDAFDGRTWDPTYRAWLLPSPTNLGIGHRWFWWCPSCSRSRKRLYRPRADLGLRCRVCWGLAYRSSQSNRRAGRIWWLMGLKLGYSGQDMKRCWDWDLREENARIRRYEWRRLKRQGRGA
jgi:hypothetical protein